MVNATVSPAHASAQAAPVPYGTGFKYVANVPPVAIGPQFRGAGEGAVIGIGVAGIVMAGLLAVGTLALGVYAVKKLSK